MKILSIHPAPPGGTAVARLDVELPCGLKLHDLSLKRAADGTLRVWAPNAFGRRVAAFPPALAIQITTAAMAALGSRSRHEHM